MDLGLSDRVYIVTGAARGLGRACADQLAAEGARLVLCGRDEAGLRATSARLGGSERALPVPGDLTEPGLETCLVAAAVARYGRLDGALVTVGGGRPGTVLDTEDGEWRTGFESMFLAPLRLARGVGRSVSSEGGSIVLVLSTSVREPVDGLALSNGLGPALAMAAKTLAEELGPVNVRVNVVLPGRVDSDAARRPDGVRHADGGHRPDGAHRPVEHVDPGAHRPEVHAHPGGSGPPVPLRRAGEPLEFARPAVFLLSPAAGYVTGATLTVDGGAARGL